MVSAFDTLFQATGMPVLSAFMAPAVSRIVGETSTDVDGAKVVSFIEDIPVEDQSAGKSVRRSGVLRLKDTQAVAATDRYDIDSVRWQAVSVGHEAGGMNVVHLARIAKETTNKGTGGRLI